MGGAIAGGTAGAAGGAVNGFGMTLLRTGSFDSALSQMVYQAGIGAFSGAIIGGLAQGITSAIKGDDFWEGSSSQLTKHNSDGQVSKKSKADIVRENYERHKKAVEIAREQLENMGAKDITSEVSFIQGGTKVRLDLVARNDGMPLLVEVKSSLDAGFTPNQKIVYPKMLNNAPIIPVGNKASSFFNGLPPSELTGYKFVIWRF